MSDSKVPAVPSDLGKRGRKLWRELSAKYEFDSHEMPVLLEACRTVDVIDGLQRLVDEVGYSTVGSTGQMVLNPAVPELRQQQAGLSRLLIALNLDAAQAGSVGLAAVVTSRAKAAANARWSKSREVRGA